MFPPYCWGIQLKLCFYHFCESVAQCSTLLPVHPCPQNVVNKSQIEKSSPSCYIPLMPHTHTHTCISCSSLMLASNSALRVCSSCSCFSPNSSISIRARFWYCSSTCSHTRQQGVEGRREIDGKRRQTREIDGRRRETREIDGKRREQERLMEKGEKKERNKRD